MTKQRRGLWLFICSLMPGAGEMCMGFRKQGLSLMGLFWGLIGLAVILRIDAILFVLPIVWCYSFFNVHNLKSLSPEEFYSIEDDYVLHLNRLSADKGSFVKKYRTVIAVALIIIGVSMLGRTLVNALYGVLPTILRHMIYDFMDMLPQLALSVGIVALGIHMILGKKKELDREDTVKRLEEEEQHENA